MAGHSTPIEMIAHKSPPLSGIVTIPGDKSVSHRALILGALSVGETKITGLLEGDDILDTAKAMRAFGAQVERHGDGKWSVYGVGVGGFSEPNNIIDCGNAGTGVRLIMGAMASTAITATFNGDASLRARPMARITDPLALFGAKSYGRAGGYLPLTIVGAQDAPCVHYNTPHASAQIKSAVLLAALNAKGESIVRESVLTRDHTERMLAGFGATIETHETKDGFETILQGQPELQPQVIAVPRDPSSAAFPLCAALIVENSEITLPNISLNPTRTGLITTLQEMGADITFQNQREEGGEPVVDLLVKSSTLSGVELPPERAASMIDEYPILSIVAAFAQGQTVMRGIAELRVKESDRIAAMVTGLRANGVTVEEGADFMIIHGMDGDVAGGGRAITHLDHRIAMSFLCLGLASKNSVCIDDGGAIATSFPSFVDLMTGLGARIEQVAP